MTFMRGKGFFFFFDEIVTFFLLMFFYVDIRNMCFLWKKLL